MLNTTTEAPNGRGCGTRSKKSAYACCGTSQQGVTIEFFVPDPAIAWPGQFQRGVKILPRTPQEPNGLNDLVIFVGKKHYPSPWDFVEEVRCFGASRKMPPTLPFDKLSPDKSRMIFVHSKAIPAFDYESDKDRPYQYCPHFYTDDDTRQLDLKKWDTAIPGHHVTPETPCAFALRDLAFFVHATTDLKSVTALLRPNEDQLPDEKFTIQMPSFTYGGTVPKTPRLPAFTPDWKVGIFLALPLTHFEFCKEADPATQAKIDAAGFQSVILDY